MIFLELSRKFSALPVVVVVVVINVQCTSFFFFLFQKFS